MLSKYLFRSTNGTGQIDDEREKEAMKKLNMAVETERRKRDDAVDVAVKGEQRKRDEAVEAERRKRDEAVEAAVKEERRKWDEAVEAERRKRDEAERKLKDLEEQLKRLQAT
jgi:hypothetical protein